ncbi:MAG: hypothetical protein RLO38_02680 [Roseovarius confluentis]
MNAFGAELWGVPGSSRPSSQLRLRKTNSGFAVTDTSDRLHRNALEKALKTMGILLLPLGIVLLLAPSGQQSQGIPIPGIGLAAAMAIVGFALYVYASRGFGTELRIDSFNREIKIGTVNAKGDFSLRKTIAASETQSLFLMRAAPPKPARLCMRSKKGGHVIKIINGSEEELIPVLERITEAFRPKHMANKRVRTRVTGAFIHATFV